MAQILLDTNIVIYLISGENDQISDITMKLIDGFENQLYVSSVSIVELFQLLRIGKINPKRYKNNAAISAAIENEFFIKILPFAKPHTEILAKLKIATAHNDPFDHANISHAIADKLTLVSSDRKFNEYTSQNLKFVFNKR